MSEVQQALTAAAYALFALEQPLSLDEIAAGARAGTFPGAALHTPGWFAAAADSGDLLSMAPELQALPPDGDDEADLTGVDLIRVYAPEMAERRALPEEPTERTYRDVDSAEQTQPRESTRISLLRELENLDD